MGKCRLHHLFHNVPAIRPYLPDSAICTLTSLKHFLNKYKTVYIKPDGGGRGIGVAKAWKANKRYGYILERGIPAYSNTIAGLYRQLRLADRPYLVQQSIDLARTGGRRFDIRLMMMRDQRKKWTYVGMLAKVAGKNSVITNVARGRGYVLPINTALKQSLGWTGKRAKMKKQEMIRLAHHCNHAYSRIRYDWQIGYDMALDRKGKVWLIEANPTIPSHALFLKLKDRSIYRRIKRFASYHR